ncbi:16S rRNA (cytosine(1402)-N(4))-methyltransferase RsmH [Candidatus Gracilibacteria bacterium]|nr:16S rRNA (cytosine(1402)-N(4))-methyltransferase RsmH [Candidatus Gracilibacteria bacterium]MCF7856103.1 16S rRNA (cytosine(1402)-N(4))-methyltransferase RsmH [Candidatus Gracilibacteria bacterium]MCF7896522.1 16S rRNA (cytosine(1402)-N(4))-methyltransferase RsmH [Candidatus Gracilibacteria bacterium]
MSHLPVLPVEVLELLAPKAGEVFLDGTLGLGGHAGLILEKIRKTGKLIGLDLDSRNLELAQNNLQKFSNLETHQANFRDLLKFTSPASLDGILLDLGVSSLHFDDASRGFSFQNLGKLDMRFDSTQPLDAAAILNSFPENEIADIFYKFGEIRSSRKIAKQIVEFRRKQKFRQTEDLVNLIAHPKLLPQVFQALRIRVNSELENLEQGLNSAVEALKSGGRIAVISFHSLEDRIVKNFFREQKKLKILEILTKKAVGPSASELAENPRSRSAKLRGARKF